jgi:putative lipoprotein
MAMAGLACSTARTLTFLFALVLVTGCANNPRDPWFSQDKFLHFGVAAGISAAATKYHVEDGVRPSLARQRAVMFTLSLGTAKELYDQEVKGTFFSWRDMTWNLLGAACGAYAVTLFD